MAPSPTVTAAYQPGKAPLLLDDSPSGINAFTRSAKLFFRIKKVTEEDDKIAYLGAGLAGYPELYNWYASAAEEHEQKTYATFVGDLQKRALPRDYVWEAKGRIRSWRQGSDDFEDWLDDVRTEHLSLTDKILPIRDFVEILLYNMDSELSAVLRRGTALKNTGFHEDDLATVAFAVVPLAFTAPVNYEKFDHEARDKWSRIAARRRSNEQQLKSLSKKTGSLTLGSGKTTTKDNTRAPRLTTIPTIGIVGNGRDNATRPSKLTELERDWLGSTKGCFKCRKSWVDHTASACDDWAPVGTVVPVPAGWSKNQVVPANLIPAAFKTKVEGIRAVHIEDDDEVELPESLAYGTDSDESDGCALPPLSLLLGSKRQSRLVCALADSGSSLSLISDKLVRELGLEKRRLVRPKRFRVAIKGEEEFNAITEFVRVPLSLSNGSWNAGVTTLLVAPLEDPFEIILSVPFLSNHRLSISLSNDEPQLFAPSLTGGEPYDLFAPVFGPVSRLEALGSEEEQGRLRILADTIAALHQSTNDEQQEQEEMK
jgi:hypothetical protein